jgi:hypothetical protein
VLLDYVKSKGMQGPTLFVTLTTSSHIQSGEIEIANAQADIALLGSETPGFAALKIADAVQNGDFVSVLGTLMESIIKIGDEFAKVRCRPVLLVPTLKCIGQDPSVCQCCVDGIDFSVQGILLLNAVLGAC